MNGTSDSDQKDWFASGTIKSVLLVLAFITPYMLAVPLWPVTSTIMRAPLWRYASSGYPVFWVYPLEFLVLELPFGLIRLVFIRAVLRYKKQLTTATRLVLTGILCELPGVIMYAFTYGRLVLPFPLFLVVGLLLARYCTKEPPSWLEVEESKHAR